MKFRFRAGFAVVIILLSCNILICRLQAQTGPAEKLVTVYTDSVFICEPDTRHCAEFELFAVTQLIFDDNGILANANVHIDGFGPFEFVMTGPIEQREKNGLKYFVAPMEDDGLYIFLNDEDNLAIHSFITKQKVITLKEKKMDD